MAASDGTVTRYDGSPWTATPSMTTWDLSSVWGSSATDVYAVGAFNTLFRHDGAAWSKQYDSQLVGTQVSPHGRQRRPGCFQTTNVNVPASAGNVPVMDANGSNNRSKWAASRPPKNACNVEVKKVCM